MKNMIITLTLLFFTYGYTHAQSFASARIVEGVVGSRIIVVYEDGDSEIIPMEALSNISDEKSNEAFIENHIILNNFFNNMAASGYKIVEMTPLGRGGVNHPPVFVLFKKE